MVDAYTLMEQGLAKGYPSYFSKFSWDSTPEQDGEECRASRVLRKDDLMDPYNRPDLYPDR